MEECEKTKMFKIMKTIKMTMIMMMTTTMMMMMILNDDNDDDDGYE